MHRSRVACAAAAAACFGVFIALALAVGRGPDPPSLMGVETALVDHATLVAWWFTNLGYAFVLGPLCLVAIGVAVARPAWRVPAALLIVSLLLSWQGADFWQHIFARPRRLDWVWKHETAFGFPSSHAAIAAGFYGFGAWLLARSATLTGRVLGACAAVLALGIVWSRLALGAHYLTDVLAGTLWGCAVVLSLVAVVSPIKVLGGNATAP